MARRPRSVVLTRRLVVAALERMDAEEHGLRAPCRCHPEPRGLHILELSLHSGAEVLGTLLSQSLTQPAKPGPGGALGALEGISYLFVPGLVAYSLYTKVPPSPPPHALSRSAGQGARRSGAPPNLTQTLITCSR